MASHKHWEKVADGKTVIITVEPDMYKHVPL